MRAALLSSLCLMLFLPAYAQDVESMESEEVDEEHEVHAPPHLVSRAKYKKLTPTADEVFALHLNVPRMTLSETCETDLCNSLVELIENAESSIDFAIYGVRGQPQVLYALLEAKKRGVKIRGVVDRTVDGKNYYSDTDWMVEQLGTVRDDLESDRREAERRRAAVPFVSRCWLPMPTGFNGPKQCVGYDIGDNQCVIGVHSSREEIVFSGEIMHNKFFVVDERYVWMGSTNASDSGTGGYNANVVGVWNSPFIASWYTNEFNQMYERGQYHDEKARQGTMIARFPEQGITVEGLFSPQDKPITNGVRPLLQNAQERIDLAVFYLTHKQIAADLIAAHQRGVQVRVIVDATSAKNGFTKHEVLRQAGIPVKIENWGGKMHAKAVAIDGQHIVIGSMNWTSAGEGGNDENTMIVHSRRDADKFHDYFDGLWDMIPDKWLDGRPDPESWDSKNACKDGVDNDYDHEADREDPGCSRNPPPMDGLPPITVVPKEPGHELVKGVSSVFAGDVYYTPNNPRYGQVKVKKPELWFCSEYEAREAGLKRAK
ncbi:MAG: phospholipase D-like domain-containing protein [Myxococcota bacterium]